jgi:hypothetical protein
MPRYSAEHYELTDAEKRDLIKLIEQGKPLPEQYRFLLFDDKREVELVWIETMSQALTQDSLNAPAAEIRV